MGPIRSSARCTWAQRSARQPSLCGAVIEPPVFCGSSAGPASPDRKAILGRGGAGAVLEVAHDPPPTGMEIQTMYISRPSYLGHRPKALAVQAVLTLRRHPPDQQGRWGEVATKARNELAVAFQSQGLSEPEVLRLLEHWSCQELATPAEEVSANWSSETFLELYARTLREVDQLDWTLDAGQVERVIATLESCYRAGLHGSHSAALAREEVLTVLRNRLATMQANS